MVLPSHCELTTNFACKNASEASQTMGSTADVLDCDRYHAVTKFGNLTDDSLVMSHFVHGNWTLYQFLPSCWNVLEPLLCGSVRATCRRSDPNANLFNLRRLPSELCKETHSNCPLLVNVFQEYPRFLNCEGEIYSSADCGSQLRVYESPSIHSLHCFPPSQPTLSENLWLPNADYCGIPCDQLPTPFRWNPLFTLAYFAIQLIILILLHFAPRKNTHHEFKLVKFLVLLDSLVTFCVSVMPFVDNFAMFCDEKSHLVETKIFSHWSPKFVLTVAVAFFTCFALSLEWLWLALRLKYFPMTKCLAFGDKQYQTIAAAPNKVKTANFIVLLFVSVLTIGLFCTATITPNFFSRLPQIEVNHSHLYLLEPMAITCLQIAVALILLIDAVRHEAFKFVFIVLTCLVCFSGAARIYCFHASSNSQSLLINFYFEDIWKCNLEATQECPRSIPPMENWWIVALSVIKLFDYILLLYIIHILLPFRKSCSFFSKVKSAIRTPSIKFVPKSRPKVTVLVSNPSSDGMIETFYSPSPSMNNFKDIQIVHLGGALVHEKEIKSSNEAAKLNTGKHALVHAEISNITTPDIVGQHKSSQDHQLVNCPDCAKTIRVATWVNYLPQPIPRRKNIPVPSRRGLTALTSAAMAGSPTSSNTFSPVYPLQVPRSPHFNIPPAPPSTASRSFPGSPVLSHRSSSLGSSRKNNSIRSARTHVDREGNVVETSGLNVLPESHRRILSQYNASPVALRRKKPLSPLVTNDRKVDANAASGSQSHPTTLRAQRDLVLTDSPVSTPRPRESRPRDLDLDGGNRISNSTASQSNGRGSDSFDSEEDARTEIGLCTSLL